MPAHSTPRPEQLTGALETALLRELQHTWAHLNHLHFKGSLRPVAVDLSDMDRALAKWRPDDRTVVFSRRLVVSEPWPAVIEVLKHEMAHQYVTEVLGVRDEAAHGPAFRRVCERHGIDASAAGLPNAIDDDQSRAIRKIQRLLALGGSPNEHEAQAAMNAAQRLMLRHNIAWAGAAVSEEYGFRPLGEPTLKVRAHQRVLAGLLGDHFFVRPVWVPAWIPERGKRGKVLEVSGSPPNLETAEYVHRYLSATAHRLWRDYKATHEVRLRGERGRYLLGVMLGFREKLEEQAARHEQEGLVWVGDAGLESYLDRRHPKLRSTGKVRYRMTPAWEAGRREGRQLRIRDGVTERPQDRRRLLGD